MPWLLHLVNLLEPVGWLLLVKDEAIPCPRIELVCGLEGEFIIIILVAAGNLEKGCGASCKLILT